MKVLLPSTGTELDFVSDGGSGWFSATLNGATSGAPGTYVGGAVFLKGETRLTKRDVRTIDLTVRVPLINMESAAGESIVAEAVNATLADYTTAKNAAYIQAKLTLTLPNSVPLRGGFTNALPTNMGAANLLAVGVAIETLVSLVIRQGTSESPTLAHGEYLVKVAEAATGWLDPNHPFFLGAYGAVPINGTNREPAIAAAVGS